VPAAAWQASAVVGLAPAGAACLPQQQQPAAPGLPVAFAAAAKMAARLPWLTAGAGQLTHPAPALPRPAGSTHIGPGAHRCWGKQQFLFGGMFSRRVRPPALAEILRLVQKANLALSLTATDNMCPYLPEYCDKAFWPDSPYKIPPKQVAGQGG
jgi:hypothetical protein